MGLTAKHLRVLRMMAKLAPDLLVARWDNDVLRDLTRAGLVSCIEAINMHGVLSSYQIYYITDLGVELAKPSKVPA